jgi:hypothetical protein
LDESAKKNQDVIRRFAWEIASISVHLEEIRLSGKNLRPLSKNGWREPA